MLSSGVWLRIETEHRTKHAKSVPGQAVATLGAVDTPHHLARWQRAHLAGLDSERAQLRHRRWMRQHPRH
ncbi:hypothetical protein AS9A_P20041 (plasmid) [Hoyosella subflava DQS3-9A1]|uniref:Uncharacterized protein n=1 Tax=Hoyosella subflava (strain DSM 45089 / JCM 17490 / NBRC 109087 / DQS3-9A1) TaxID=443218 RepID=F6ESG4_HOYSD|nr:hypothetical protein AS9A_P20041 [Hoyosella subflava DQS3-9A1]